LNVLRDPANSLDGRFDLAYASAHALCLAALRYRGFRPSKRYIVFQVLPDTLGLGPETWRVLSKCHDLRNRTEESAPDGVVCRNPQTVSDHSLFRDVSSKPDQAPQAQRERRIVAVPHEGVPRQHEECQAGAPYPRKTSMRMSASGTSAPTRLREHASTKPGAPHK
jgi:hypothetical protein